MANPIKYVRSGSDIVALGEFISTDSVDVSHGGTGATTAPGARTNLEIYSKTELNTSGAGGLVHWDNIIGAAGATGINPYDNDILNHFHTLDDIVDISEISGTVNTKLTNYIHVDPTGDNNANGSVSSPIQTIQGAINYIIANSAAFNNNRIVVNISPGRYVESLVLGSVTPIVGDLHIEFSANSQGSTGNENAVVIDGAHPYTSFSCSSNNNGIKGLIFNGITFTGAIDISGVGNGHTNFRYVAFKDCKIQYSSVPIELFVLTNIYAVRFINTIVETRPQFANCHIIHSNNSSIISTTPPIISSDFNANWPDFGTLSVSVVKKTFVLVNGKQVNNLDAWSNRTFGFSTEANLSTIVANGSEIYLTCLNTVIGSTTLTIPPSVFVELINTKVQGNIVNNGTLRLSGATLNVGSTITGNLPILNDNSSYVGYVTSSIVQNLWLTKFATIPDNVKFALDLLVDGVGSPGPITNINIDNQMDNSVNNHTHYVDDIIDFPSTFPPSQHNHEFVGHIFVTKGGNDLTGDGSFTKPFLTISAAITKAIISNPNVADISGIVINIAKGVYVEDVIISQHITDTPTRIALVAFSPDWSVGETVSIVSATGYSILCNSFNEVLIKLSFTGFSFDGNTQFIGQTNNTGFSNLEFTNCTFSSAYTHLLYNINNVKFDSSNLYGGFSVTNVYNIELYRCELSNQFQLISDFSLNKPVNVISGNMVPVFKSCKFLTSSQLVLTNLPSAFLAGPNIPLLTEIHDSTVNSTTAITLNGDASKLTFIGSRVSPNIVNNGIIELNNSSIIGTISGTGQVIRKDRSDLVGYSTLQGPIWTSAIGSIPIEVRDALDKLVVKVANGGNEVVIFNSPSSGTWTVPPGVYVIWLSMCGGGGGGGAGCNGHNTNNGQYVSINTGCGGNGGSGAESIVKMPVSVVPGALIPYTVAAGGSGAPQHDITVVNQAYSSSTFLKGSEGNLSIFGDIVAHGGAGGYGHVRTATSQFCSNSKGSFESVAPVVTGGIADPISNGEYSNFLDGNSGGGFIYGGGAGGCSLFLNVINRYGGRCGTRSHHIPTIPSPTLSVTYVDGSAAKIGAGGGGSFFSPPTLQGKRILTGVSDTTNPHYAAGTDGGFGAGGSGSAGGAFSGGVVANIGRGGNGGSGIIIIEY